MYGVYLLKFHPGWSVRDSFLYAGSYCVTYPFYAPLNLQADKLIILIIFLPNNAEFSFLGTSLEICAVSNFRINDFTMRAVSFFSFESQYIRTRMRGENRSNKEQASSAPISPPLYH